MELIACNFEFFPQVSKVYEFLHPLLDGCVEIRFPYSIGKRNSNQFTFDFDSQLQANLLASGGQLIQLALPKTIRKKCDFSFSFGGKVVVVEVEKANREKILYDLLKFHMYLRHEADFGLLFLPKNYPHSNGEWKLFDWGKTRYQQSRDFGFGSSDILDRILIVGYEQRTLDGAILTRQIRASLIANRSEMSKTDGSL